MYDFIANPLTPVAGLRPADKSHSVKIRQTPSAVSPSGIAKHTTNVRFILSLSLSLLFLVV